MKLVVVLERGSVVVSLESWWGLWVRFWVFDGWVIMIYCLMDCFE